MGKSDDFDLADRVDDLICIFEGGNPDGDVDTLSIFVTGLVIIIVFSLGSIKYLFRRLKQKLTERKGAAQSQVPAEVAKPDPVKLSATENSLEKLRLKHDAAKPTASKSTDTAKLQNLISQSSEKPLEVAPTPSRRSRKQLSDQSRLSLSLDLSDKNKGACLGPDGEIVDYVNKCYEWFDSPETSLHAAEWDIVKRQFIGAVNKLLRDEAKKGVFLASVSSVSLQEEMDVTNLFAECDHENNIRITCDCETKMIGSLDVRLGAGSVTGPLEKSRHDFFVDRLCGRLSILIECEESFAIIKFDGWPEICTGMKNSSQAGLDPKISEKIVENLNSAIRNVCLEVDLRAFNDFPLPPKVSPKSKLVTGTFLSLRVLKGIDIGLKKECEQPYCAIELDDPPQKFQTDLRSGSCPLWDEEFVLSITPGKGDILFEVFDNVGMKFLGCNILSLEEIKDDSIHVIPLKSRRMEASDGISGGIEVQFKFIGETMVHPRPKSQTSDNLIVPTKSAFRKPPISNRSELQFQVGEISNSGETVRMQFIPLNPPDSSTSIGEAAAKPEHLDWQYGEERGRRKTRRGNIFTSIRRRFSKSRSHSASRDGSLSETEAEPDYYHKKRRPRRVVDSDNFARSISVDRDHVPQNKSLLPSGSGHLSTRSSASELSNFSGFSTTTYVHENSTLIIECLENGIHKYYLIPTAMAESGKWKKAGKKLHIYNDHTFIAKQTPSGTVCEVCGGRFPFSLRKQAYSCRDCKLKCHKECHVRVGSFCPNTSIYDIELEYVSDTN